MHDGCVVVWHSYKKRLTINNFIRRVEPSEGGDLIHSLLHICPEQGRYKLHPCPESWELLFAVFLNKSINLLLIGRSFIRVLLFILSIIPHRGGSRYAPKGEFVYLLISTF